MLQVLCALASHAKWSPHVDERLQILQKSVLWACQSQGTLWLSQDPQGCELELPGHLPISPAGAVHPLWRDTAQGTRVHWATDVKEGKWGCCTGRREIQGVSWPPAETAGRVDDQVPLNLEGRFEAAKKPIHKHEMFISSQHCFPTKGGSQARGVKLLLWWSSQWPLPPSPKQGDNHWKHSSVWSHSLQHTVPPGSLPSPTPSQMGWVSRGTRCCQLIQASSCCCNFFLWCACGSTPATWSHMRKPVISIKSISIGLPLSGSSWMDSSSSHRLPIPI